MTKKNPKTFLIDLGINPNKENMTKFYKHGRSLSEIKAGINYMEEDYNKEVKNFKQNII